MAFFTAVDIRLVSLDTVLLADGVQGAVGAYFLDVAVEVVVPDVLVPAPERAL
jgi:hypothetical protein